MILGSELIPKDIELRTHSYVFADIVHLVYCLSVYCDLCLGVFIWF